jgi:putative molybdopterin biosynthesis protein
MSERKPLTWPARAVDQGEASVDGIQAAATAYGLDFVPLAQEQYDLVFPEPVWATPVAQALPR